MATPAQDRFHKYLENENAIERVIEILRDEATSEMKAIHIAERVGTKAFLIHVTGGTWIRFGDDEAQVRKTTEIAADYEGVSIEKITELG